MKKTFTKKTEVELNSLNLYAYETINAEGMKERQVLRIWLDENGKIESDTATPELKEKGGLGGDYIEIDANRLTMSDDLRSVELSY